MKTLLSATLLLLAASPALAQHAYSFQIEGQRVRISAPRNCASLSCVSVSVPGVFESGRPGGRVARLREEEDARPVAAPRAAPAPRTEAPAAPAAPTRPAPLFAEPASNEPLAPQAAVPVQPPVPASPPAATAEPMVAPQAPMAALPPTASPPPAPETRVEPSPLGVWATEGRKGLVRIEACGRNLCGYAVDARSGANGERVLIDMRPQAGAKWGGQIYDPNSGRTYDATVALKGAGSLRVQGCAFGGMFCGGQTWNRAS